MSLTLHTHTLRLIRLTGRVEKIMNLVSQVGKTHTGRLSLKLTHGQVRRERGHFGSRSDR